MGNKEVYEIRGIKYEQTELTWKKDQQVIALYNELTTGPFKDEEIRLNQLQPLLVKSGLLNKFYGVILDPVINIKFIISFKWVNYLIKGTINIDHAPNSTIGKIFNDFFYSTKNC